MKQQHRHDIRTCRPVILLFTVTVLLLILHATVSAQQPVTITTPRRNYQAGDQVFVTVTVTSPSGVNADMIAVFVWQPNNVSNYFQTLPSTGGTVNFTLAPDAPVGNYTVFAEWGQTQGQGQRGQNVQTWFIVSNIPVPEFPIGTSLMMVLVLIQSYGNLLLGGTVVVVSLIVAIWLILKRRPKPRRRRHRSRRRD